MSAAATSASSGMLPQRRHSAGAIEAEWVGPGTWHVIGAPLTVKRVAGRWFIFGTHATGHGPFSTMAEALRAVEHDRRK